jgi:hypothetical protein
MLRGDKKKVGQKLYEKQILEVTIGTRVTFQEQNMDF